jgi:ribose transport system substrate-binding protein
MQRRDALLLMLSSLVVGCQKSSNSGGKKKLRIAVIPKGTTHEFWKSVHAGAVNAAMELGNVEILWKGPLQENDREGQINVMQEYITKRVDGICLAPLDSQSLVPVVEEAGEANIPVVIFDSALEGNSSNYVSYVATDNLIGGALAARRMAEVLDGKGSVILLRYNPGSDSTHQREEGFLATLKKEFPGINILLSNEYAGTTPESSLTKATDVLSKYRDKVDGIFAVCEPNATGVLGALEELEQAGKVKFIAFDPNQPLIQGLTNNHVDGIVLQDPVKMGYEAVMSMAKHLNGKDVQKRINTGEYVATPENMNETQMNKLLHPQQFGE